MVGCVRRVSKRFTTTQPINARLIEEKKSFTFERCNRIINYE